MATWPCRKSNGNQRKSAEINNSGQAGWLPDWLAGCLAAWLAGCLAACWLACWLAGWLAGWLVGWLALGIVNISLVFLAYLNMCTQNCCKTIGFY